MKKLYFLLFCIALSPAFLRAQSGGYDIHFNIKGLADTTMYLARYYYDQTGIIDSSKHIKNGMVHFKGNAPLPRGMYILATQERARLIEFLVDDTQKFTISGDMNSGITSLKSADSKENNEMLQYARFMGDLDKRYKKAVDETKGRSKADSTAYITEKTKSLNDEVKKFEADFLARNKGTFVYDFMNLRTEKFPVDVPKASNGRPDSIYQYRYYKEHFFDGVDFKDDRIVRTPFIAPRIKKYFDEVVVQVPDSVIKEIDKMMSQTTEGGDLYKSLIGYFAFKYEQSKTMSFDKEGNLSTFEEVFIHVADKYIINGKSYGIYTDETVKKIKDRVEVLRRLQPNVKVPDLLMVDTTDGRAVLKMGFDTAKTSGSVTYLYSKNAEALGKMFKTLYEVKAKYTVLVFWAADCGHCQKEIPKLAEGLKELKGKVDFKVFAVETKDELFDSWKKFIIEKKLNDFINVFDPVHINNTRETFDVTGTPVIYILDRDKRIKGKKVDAEQVPEILLNIDKLDKKP